MKKLNTILLNALFLTLCGTGLVAYFWGSDCLREQPPLADVPQPLGEGIRDDELVQKTQALFRRSQARTRIVTDVSVGRLSLLEAAAQFGDLNRTWPEINWDLLRIRFPESRSEDELLCQHVICHVECLLWHDPRRTEVVTRLQKELEAHLEQGTLQMFNSSCPRNRPSPNTQANGEAINNY